MNRKRALLLLAACCLLLLSASGAGAQCTDYTGSHSEPGSGIGQSACVGGGPGCTECIDWWPNPSTWFSVCHYTWGGDYICFYYNVDNRDL